MSKQFFSISTQFSSIWPIDRTLSGATTPGQSGPGSDGNEGVLHIPVYSTAPADWVTDFFVLWHINLCGFFNAKAMLVEEQ